MIAINEAEGRSKRFTAEDINADKYITALNNPL